MTIELVREKLQEALKNVGIELDYTEGQDLNLQDYIEDSLQYITAVVEIENALDIDLPDELLVFDSLVSFHSFSEAILEVIQSKND